MKRWIWLIAVLFAFGVADAQDSVIVAKKKAASCGATSEPAGDVFSDGFEGSGSGGYELNACGSAPCWTENPDSSAVDQAYALSGLSGGTGATQNCNYGAKVPGGGKYLKYTLASGLATPYVYFSFYIDDLNFSGWQTDPIACIGNNACSIQLGYLKLNCNNGTGCTTANLQVSGVGATESTARAISIDTWYYVKLTLADAASCKVSVGTTYGGTEIANEDTFNCNDVAADPQYFHFGDLNNRTMNIIFGYIAVDDDGTL